MATDTAVHHDNKADWSGGKDPFKASYGKLMMWYFLLSDAFTFSGFLIAYGAIRFSSPAWPVPDFVFSTIPGFLGPIFGGVHNNPLIFVTIMTFVLLFSSYTMVRAVQEGVRENKNAVAAWMFLTVLGGAAFLGCQAWEWKTLIGAEHMSVTTNPFGTHLENGYYLGPDGKISDEKVIAGESYLMHMNHPPEAGHGDHGSDHGADHGAEEHHVGHSYAGPGDYPDAVVDERGYIHRKFKITEGPNAGKLAVDEDGNRVEHTESFGPKAFGALFFFITGFHGFHVLSGVVFLIIIMINVMTGLYVKRKNGYEMVEKIGLYWHFVDLVWVFVFLVFYLL